MTQSNSSGKKTKTTLGAVVLAVLVGGYTLLRPAVNEATGWNLPAIAQQQEQPVAASPTSKNQPLVEREASLTSTKANPPAAENETKSGSASSSKSDTKSTSESKRKPGPLAGKFSTKPKSTTIPGKSTTSGAAKMDAGKASPTKSATPTVDPSLKYGLLREVGKDRYLSPSGLQYTPGSAEGHRLKHLERHTSDQPNRPGKHGVFDGGMEGALKTIEKAYEKAKVGSRTTKQVDQGRTIYTVDMSKRVGYIGGRDGNRQRKPMARRVRLVLEGTRVITAFPL